MDLLKPFWVKAVIYDPYITDSALCMEPFAVSALLQRCKKVLKEADILTIHAAQTLEIYRMLAEPRLNIIKKGAVLVNTARGSLIDEDALLKKLA